MITPNLSTTCRYYDGKVPEARQATLTTVEGNRLVLTSGELTRTYVKHQISVSPRIGSAGRFVKLADGGQCYCEDHPFLDRLPQQDVVEGPVAWLERHVGAAIASVALVVVALALGYFYGLPAMAESVITRIPVETEAALGENVLSWLDEQEWFAPSEVDPARIETLKASFGDLHTKLAMSPHIVLEFRSSELVGANAFALPGGTVVVTDQLVKLAGSDQEILAILAHEAGHVEGHHAMRMILQNSFAALLFATVTSDVSSAGAAFTGIPLMLLQNKHSRELESEADSFAFSLLKEHGISPEAFATMMEKLTEESDIDEEYSYLSTHPAGSERIEKAREAND